MHRLLLAATAALCSLTHVARAQAPEAVPAPRAEKLAEWPPLPKADRDRARAHLKQLRKDKQALRDAASAKLVAMEKRWQHSRRSATRAPCATALSQQQHRQRIFCAGGQQE